MAKFIATVLMGLLAFFACQSVAAALTPTPQVTPVVTGTVPAEATGTATATRTPLAHPTEIQFPTPAPPAADVGFTIAVHGVPECSTLHGDAACTIPLGSTFIVDVQLDPRSILPYGGFDIQVDYTGVSSNRDASAEAWPDCVFSASSYDTPDSVLFACAVGLPPASGSTYAGVIGTLTFDCVKSGSITIQHGERNTDLLEFDDISKVHVERLSGEETLTINCGDTLALPSTGIAAHDGATSRTLFALAAAVCSVGLLAAGWWVRRAVH